MTTASTTATRCLWHVVLLVWKVVEIFLCGHVPSPIGMQCRSVCIKVRLNASVLNFVHKSIHPLCLSTTASKQWLLYGNSRFKIDQYYPKVCAYLDQHGLTGDVVKVTGPMFKEQKLFYTNLFLAGVNARPAVAPAVAPPAVAALPAIDPPAVAPPIVDLFKPIGCIATRALGAAGWDGRNIFLVMSCDLPTDLCSVVQEKGRAGRRPGSLPTENSYEVCVSLQSYTYLLRRIHLAPADEHVATEGGYVPISSTDIVTLLEYRTQQVTDLFSVLQLFVLPQECMQCTLER